MDLISELANLKGAETQLAPCGCGTPVHFCSSDDLGHDHDCHILVCPKCGSFDLAQGADPDNKCQTLEELRQAIIPVWNRTVRAKHLELYLTRELVLEKAANAGFPINLQKESLVDFATDIAATVMSYMILEGKKSMIASYGYGIYEVDNKFIIADPRDGEQGFYLEGTSLIEVVESTYEYLQGIIV